MNFIEQGLGNTRTRPADRVAQGWICPKILKVKFTIFVCITIHMFPRRCGRVAEELGKVTEALRKRCKAVAKKELLALAQE